MLQVVCQSKDDQVTVVGAGVTLHEALAAAEQLKKGMDRYRIHMSCKCGSFQIHFFKFIAWSYRNLACISLLLVIVRTARGFHNPL